MKVYLISGSNYYLYENGKLIEEGKREDDAIFSGHRCIWIGTHGVSGIKYKKGHLDDVLKELSKEAVYVEEKIQEDKKTKEITSNVFYTEESQVVSILTEQPICLVPYMFLIKKVYEDRKQKNKAIIGYYYAGKFMYAVLDESGLVKEKGMREIKLKDELEKRLETKYPREEYDWFIVEVTISEEEFINLLENYVSYLSKEFTFLNETLKEIFEDTGEQKKLIISLAVAGALILSSISTYSFLTYLKLAKSSEIENIQKQIKNLERKVLELQQEKLYFYTKSKTQKPYEETNTIPIPEYFLKSISVKNKKLKAVFLIPSELMSIKEEFEIIKKIKKEPDIIEMSLNKDEKRFQITYTKRLR